MEDYCDSSKGGFYLIKYLEKMSGNYPNPESCTDVSQQVNCVSNLTIPFFGIFNIAFVMITVGFAYPLLKKNHKI
jgi:lipoprotein signal peptidase